jgi:hypothetical protein
MCTNGHAWATTPATRFGRAIARCSWCGAWKWPCGRCFGRGELDSGELCPCCGGRGALVGREVSQLPPHLERLEAAR